MTERVIRIIIDPSGARAGGDQVKATLFGLETQSRGLNTTLRTLQRAAAGVIAAFSVRELIQTTSEYQSLQNRLRTVTDSQEELIATQNELARISRGTRTELGSTVSLYQRAAIAADELGASQEELFRLVEISGKAIAIQGGAASEASGALRQLSQSFSSGIVRAEEFNSILEGAFPIAQAAARGLDAAGGSVGRLRQLVVEGKVSSREFFEAILEGGADLDAVFAQTEVTISQALTVLGNSFLIAVGKINEATGAGETFADLIVKTADVVDTLTDALIGTLEPTDQLSRDMKQLATVGVIVGTVFQQVFEIIGLIPAIVNEIGRSLGATFAAAEFAIKGEFGAAWSALQEAGGDTASTLREKFADAFEDMAVNAQSASDRISEIWLEDFRDLPDPSRPPERPRRRRAADDTIDEETLKKQAAFIENLRRQASELGIETRLLDDAAAELLRYNVALDAAALGGAAFVETALTAAEAVISQQDALERARKASEDVDLVSGLREELELLQLTERERAIEIELRKLSTEATAEQREEIERLAGSIFDQEEALRKQTDFMKATAEQAARNIQDAFADFLFDPFDDGLEGLVSNFGDALRRMAAEAIAQDLFGRIFGGLGGAGGSANPLANILGGFLPGAATGADWMVGGAGGTDSQLVTFRATPGEQISVRTPEQQREARSPMMGGGQPVVMHNTFVLPREDRRTSLGRTQTQIAAATFQAVSRASRRNN